MRIIFMGTPDFAVVSLRKLIETRENIVAVVTAPDKKKGRGQKIGSSAVKSFANGYNLPILQPENLKDQEFISRLAELEPDLICVVAFRILPEEVFTIPPGGTINLHGSLLPKYRGAAPINWAIINGETETGVTTFFIKKAVDTGNIIETEKIKIEPDMTAGQLHDIMAEVGANVLLRTLNRIKTGNITTKKQDDSMATRAPKIRREHCQISFNQSAQQVHNFIRGLSPSPGSFTYWNKKTVKMHASQILDNNNKLDAPGSIISTGKSRNELVIQCSPGLIKIGIVQIEGKKQMPIEEFLRGYPISAGEQL